MKNVVLVQTRVPAEAYSELHKRAEKKGISISALVRQFILKATGVDGSGKRVSKGQK